MQYGEDRFLAGCSEPVMSTSVETQARLELAAELLQRGERMSLRVRGSSIWLVLASVYSLTLMPVSQ